MTNFKGIKFLFSVKKRKKYFGSRAAAAPVCAFVLYIEPLFRHRKKVAGGGGVLGKKIYRTCFLSRSRPNASCRNSCCVSMRVRFHIQKIFF